MHPRSGSVESWCKHRLGFPDEAVFLSNVWANLPFNNHCPTLSQQLVFWETWIAGYLEHVQSCPVSVLMCTFLAAVTWGSFPFPDSPLIRCPRWNSCSFGPISVDFFCLRHFRNSYFGYCYFDGYLCHWYLLAPDGFQFGTPRDICCEEFFIWIELGISASGLEMVLFLCCSGILPPPPPPQFMEVPAAVSCSSSTVCLSK